MVPRLSQESHDALCEQLGLCGKALQACLDDCSKATAKACSCPDVAAGLRSHQFTSGDAETTAEEE